MRFTEALQESSVISLAFNFQAFQRRFYPWFLLEQRNLVYQNNMHRDFAPAIREFLRFS